ncbi:hypothetical protein Mal33_51690 [Rosistilla oblonga]|uniref:Uncharacterized protein n=2 Tax=Rosistilla oblonga TaxID=2527990 RepID=A0A518J1C3_9BACT|nr:hypothetical protein Mal33_51690 [Rosistilla oblonga]
MVIQPMAIAHAGCAQGACCNAQTRCNACNSCEVGTDGGLCGCCSRIESKPSGCCDKTPGKEQRDDTSEGSVGKLSPGDGEDLTNGQPSFSSCRCGVRSEPIAPAPQRSPVSQERDLVVIAYLDHTESDSGLSILPDHGTLRLPIGSLAPHFSQRILCIWRI